jgi:HK97 family phage major capsid protein
LQELQQKAAALATEMRTLHASVPDGTAMTGEQRSKWEEMRSALNTLQEQIKREEELRAADQSFVESRSTELENQARRDNGDLGQDEQRAAAFDAFMRRGLGELTTALKPRARAMPAAIPCRPPCSIAFSSACVRMAVLPRCRS